MTTDQIVMFTSFIASAVAGETVAQGRHRYRQALEGLSRLAFATQRISATESQQDAWRLAAVNARELTNARAAAVVSGHGGVIRVLSASPPEDQWRPEDLQALRAGQWDERWTRGIANDPQARRITTVKARAQGGELRLELLTQALSEHMMRLELVERLQHEALSDALTGIGNRRAAMQQLESLRRG